MAANSTLTIGAAFSLILGCATGHSAPECPEARPPAAPAPVHSGMADGPAASSAPEISAAPSAPAQSGPVPAASPGTAANSGAAASAESSLPELKVQLSGMHIGGGPNDEVNKRPFIHAIESSFDAMRVCYKKAEDPTRGGTFGVDLKIGRKGGLADVQQVRTALKGDSLRSCLEQTFKGIQFSAPPKGPTVVSVSVRFSMSQ